MRAEHDAGDQDDRDIGKPDLLRHEGRERADRKISPQESSVCWAMAAEADNFGPVVGLKLLVRRQALSAPRSQARTSTTNSLTSDVKSYNITHHADHARYR
jgi:hypothetical protein